jgi:hypothetical protein
VSQVAPPKVGIWRAVLGLGDLRVKQLLWPEGLPALILGGGGAFLVVRATSLSTRIGATDNLVVLAGALLAISFTALAIVVSLPSSHYLRAMAQGQGGIQAFLDPFLIAVGTQLALIFLGFGYQMFAAHVARPVEHACFYALGFLLVFGLLDVGALARSLVRHGILRSRVAVDELDETGGDVRALRARER